MKTTNKFRILYSPIVNIISQFYALLMLPKLITRTIFEICSVKIFNNELYSRKQINEFGFH